MAENEKHPGWDPQADTSTVAETQHLVQRPRLYKVLLHNDDFTTMDFVVMVLKTVFYHDELKAMRTMLQVHQEGVGIAGVFSYEVAEARIVKAARLARAHEFPLKCSMEPEE